MGKILAICVSKKKGTPKKSVKEVEFVAGHGIKGDAHAGEWHRQVSLLSSQKIEEFRAKGANVNDGDFGENLIIDGIDLRSLPVGTLLKCGEVIFEITQIGKECHNQSAGNSVSGCTIYKTMGDCIMPREGVFAKVIRGGFIAAGDEITQTFGSEDREKLTVKNREPEISYSVWIVTASDRGFKGEREDLSGKVIREIAQNAGYIVAGYTLLADNKNKIKKELKRICDKKIANLILTTGGTGLSPRDCMPEATMEAANKLVPGIAEAMRANGMAITKRAMLSRSAAAIRGSSLIINLPGSPKAVRENLEFIIGDLRHALDILTGKAEECASKV